MTELIEAVGPDAIATGDAWYNLCVATRRLNDWPGTEEAAAAARRVFLKHFGPGDPRTIKAGINLGVALNSLDRPGEGIRLLRDTVRNAERSISDPILINIARINFAMVLIENDDVTEARSLIETVFADLKGRKDPTSLSIIGDARTLTEKL